VFGPTLTTADGKVVPVRWVGEQHVKEDLGWIPTLQDWFKHLRVQPWMGKAGDRQVGRAAAPPSTAAPAPGPTEEQRFDDPPAGAADTARH
jgi:hypothetical protein